MVRSDILDRGIPWTRLLLERRLRAGDAESRVGPRPSAPSVAGMLAAVARGRLARGAALLAGSWRRLCRRGHAVGEDFRGAVQPTQVALAALPLAVVAGAATRAAASRLQPRLRLRAVTAGVIAHVAITVITVPGSGALGASWALGAFFLVATLVQGTRPSLVPWRLTAGGWAPRPSCSSSVSSSD